MRGMAGIEAAVMSGMGHLTSFTGSETIPALEAVEEYYNADADSELIAGTVPATEHSVMCAGGMEDEFGTFKRLITETYPSGIVSIVSDTWDFWQVITDYLPRLKDTIMARDGRVVIRPDSGDPVKIICGDSTADPNSPEYKGAYQLLGEIFGYTTNEQGYKVLDTHIGLIYGDSITLERQDQIYSQLEAKGFAATNLVLGIGSYTYQFKSRDSLGFAMKATWCQINGVEHEIFKCPKTDSGMKKSLKGLLQVYQEDGVYKVKDQVSKEEEKQGCLQTVFKNGVIYKAFFLDEIRQRVNQTIHV
jgi:nicotinamide phosphoribosyltransferase